MDEEIERLTVSVRADTQAFARDVAEMRAQLDGPLGSSVNRAGALIEGALGRAIRSGKFGFEDLKRVGLSVLGEIANAALHSASGGGRSNQGGGLLSLGLSALGSLLGGAPGRATGGPVSPGRAYRVGERGPELFVPTSSGEVVAPTQSGAREVRISIAVNAPAGSAPEALARSSRQVARAVRGALLRED
jgi:hypothetical protein